MDSSGPPEDELLSPARFNQGLVRFIDPTPHASEEDHDRFTDSMIEAIDRDGEAFFGGTTWRGRRAMRVSFATGKLPIATSGAR